MIFWGIGIPLLLWLVYKVAEADVIGQPISPAREAWELDQVDAMRRRMELMHRVRVAVRASLITIGVIVAIGVAAMAKRLLS
jgi:hypothetical protein